LDGLEDLPVDLHQDKTLNLHPDLNKMGHLLNNNNFNPDLSLSSMPDLNLDHSLGLSQLKGSQNNPGDQLCNLNNKLSSLNLQLLCY
jgi:hypothetical protein